MPQSIIRIFTLIVLWCAASSAFANSPILLTQGSFDFAVSSYLSVLEDKERSLSIDEVAKLDKQLLFTPTHSNFLKLGFSPSNFWLRFSITNPYKSRQEVIFTLSDSDFDLVEFYQLNGVDDYWHIQDSHNQRAVSGSLMQAHSVILNVPGQSTTTYLVQFHSQGLITAHTFLVSRDQYVFKEQKFALIQGLNSGLLLGALLFFGYLFWRHRAPLAGIAFLLSASILILQPAYMRFFPVFSDISLHRTDKISEFMLGIVCLFHLACSATLEFQKGTTRVVRAILISLGVAMPLISLAIMEWLPQLTMPSVAFFTLMFNLIAAILLFWLRSKTPTVQRYLLFSHLVWGLYIGLVLLSDNNVLEMNFFSTYVVYFVPIGLLGLVCLAVLNLLPQNRSKPDLSLLHTPITPSLITQFDYALRSPINAVLGMGNILLNTPLAPQQREYLNNLNLASHDLLHVVDEMAYGGALISGSLEPQQRAFPLVDTLTPALRALHIAAERKHIRLSQEFSPSLPEQVLGDAKAVQIIVRNLFNHSLIYLEHCEMKLNVAPYFSQYGNGVRLQLQVFSANLRPEQIRNSLSLLQPQLPLTENTSEKDWQLLLTRALLNQLNAQIEVEGMTAQGASITLSLPLPNVTTPSTAPSTATPKLAGKRVLVVDGNTALQTVLSHLLQRFGMKVDSAYTGKEALALIRSQANFGHNYDVVLVEQNLTGMTGLEFMARIARDSSISQPPQCILLLGAEAMQEQERAQKQGVQQVLHKPISPEALHQALHNLMSQRP
ncbi:MAG: hypothetical protein RL217_1617 [Pseudomonadota bacterium]|jgi:CheY-like chemotaxis protein